MNFDSMIQICRSEVGRYLLRLVRPTNTMWKECQLGKQTKMRFKNKEYSTTKPLELIHIDLCEPTRKIRLNGEMYFMFLIDNFSRMTWVTFLNFLNIWFRINQMPRLSPYDQIEEENSFHGILIFFVKFMGLEGTFLLQGLLNIMVLWKEIIGLLL